MTLSEFMAWKDIGDAEMARYIGVSRVSVVRYRNGERRPEWHVLVRIRDVTGGIVTADSFMPPYRRGQKRR